MKKRTETPQTRHKRSNWEKESRRGSNQEEENTRRDCHQTEDSETKDIKEKEKQRNRTEKRNIKTGNTFSLLQEEDQEQILEEEELPSIIKIDKEEKSN